MYFVDPSRFKSLNPDASQKIEAAVTRFWRNGSLRQHLGLIAWSLFRLKNLFWVFCKVEGGIYKRLDEHRELIEFLDDHCPEIFEIDPCLRNYLDSQDVFLCQLEKILPLGKFANQPPRFNPGGQTYQNQEFPRRPRPRNHELPSKALTCLNHSEASHTVSSETPLPVLPGIAVTQHWQSIPRRERGWLTRWTLWRLDYVAWVGCCLEGGIYKRLDEHREMMEFLEQRHSKFLAQYPWLRNWLNNQEVFLSVLEKALPVGELGDLPIRFKPSGYTYQCVEYPRLRQAQAGEVISSAGSPA